MSRESHQDNGGVAASREVFDELEFMMKVRARVPEDVIKQLQDEFGEDMVGAIDQYQEKEKASKVEQFATEEEAKGAEGDANQDADGRRPVCYRDQIWDKATRRWIYKRPSKSARPTQKFARYVLVIRRVYTERLVFSHTEAEVRGQVLRNALRNIFKGAEGFPLTDKETELKGDMAVRFLYWAKPELLLLEQHYEQAGDAHALFEIKAGLQFINDEWSHMSSILETMLTTSISFDYLWAVLPPDALVVGKDILGQRRIYRVRKHHPGRRQDGTRFLQMSAEYSDCDDKIPGLVSTELAIVEYTGSMDMEDLSFTPLRYHAHAKPIRQEVLARTEHQLKFFASGFKVQDHAGIGLVEQREESWSGSTRAVVRMFHFRGRLVVDIDMMKQVEPNNQLIPELKSFRREKRIWLSELVESDEEKLEVQKRLGESPDHVPTKKPVDPSWESEDGESSALAKGLSEEQLLLFSGLVYGFSLSDEKWGAVCVDHMKDVEWNKAVFGALVMEENLKGMIFRLIETHAKGDPDFDDFIAGKGRGLIGLLSGPPGSGKTLTAEAIAETAEMPLYMVSSGALGATATSIHKNLTRILRLANHWKAVLLLDEADVFLAERTLSDLERNAVVSVFLRELEYYPGILLLTTNQPRIIDDAFLSRIHIFHHYPSLDLAARRKIWRSFMNKMRESKDVQVEVNDAGLEDLARMNMNGRQIKNATSIASKLAMAESDKTITAKSIIAAAKALEAPEEIMQPGRRKSPEADQTELQSATTSEPIRKRRREG